MKTLLCFILLFTAFNISFSFAQNEVDSLNQLFVQTQNDSSKLAINNQIIWKYIFTNKEKALKHIKISEQLSRKKGQKYGYVSLLGIKGIYYDVNGNSDSSEYYFFEFLSQSRKLKFIDHELNALNNLGTFYWNQGKLDEALSYFFNALKKQGLEMKEKLSSTEKLSLSNLYNNIGLIYQELELYSKAIDYHLKSLHLREDIEYHLGKLDSFDNLSICFLAINSKEKANAYIREGLQLSSQLEGKPNYYHFTELKAKLAEENKDYSLAKKLLLSSLNRPDNYPINQREKLSLYNHLTSISYQLKEIEAAENYLDSASLIISNSESEKTLVAKHYKLKSLISLLKGDFSAAEKSMDAFYTFTVEKFRRENAEATEKLKIAYESEKQAKKLALSEVKLKQKSNLITKYVLYSVLIFVVVLGISITIYLRYKNIKREKELERLQNQIKLKDSLEKQRKNISRELHDNVGSHLTYIVSSLHDLTNSKKDSRESEIKSLEEFTRSSIIELRDTIWAIRKESFGLLELQERIVGHVSHFNSLSESLNISVKNLVTDKQQDLFLFEPENGMHILRIIQEATHNAIKHAESTEIMIRIEWIEGRLVFSVSDNGKGFNTQQTVYSFGIKNMYSRAKEIGAQLKILSSEKGSKITLQLLRQ